MPGPERLKDKRYHHDGPRPDCPRCGSSQAKPVVYGFVDVGEYLELDGRTPDFELGGLAPKSENWCCGQCGHRWKGV